MMTDNVTTIIIVIAVCITFLLMKIMDREDRNGK
jgi:hypothetical protein